MTTLRKAIIPAAGRGTRMFPASKTVQKELFPLVDVDGFAKPTLQIIVEDCLASGLDEICIVGNPHNIDAIKAHFQAPTGSQLAALAGKEWALKLAESLAQMEQHLSFVVQTEQEGFGHAVYQARKWAACDPVLILLGDHVYLSSKDRPRCMRQIVNAWDRWNAPISTVEVVAEADIAPLGIIRGREIEPGVYKAEKIVEKPSVEEARAELKTSGLPEGHYLAHFGIHAFPPAIFDKLKYLIDHDIRRKGEFQLTSAQQLLLEDSPEYLAIKIDGRRFDMGQPEGLARTQAALALASPFAHTVLDEINRHEEQTKPTVHT